MKWIQKDSDITATNGIIIDSLNSDSTKDAPSINTVNKEIPAARIGRMFYISHIPGEPVTFGNYDERVAVGKSAASSSFN